VRSIVLLFAVVLDSRDLQHVQLVLGRRAETEDMERIVCQSKVLTKLHTGTDIVYTM